MKETYFVIRNSDGDTTVKEYTKQELLEEIGEFEFTFPQIPENSDTNYWGDGVLIIKGKVVTPTAEQVVTLYSIE